MTANESLAHSEEVDPLSDPEERRVLFAALDSFRQYRRAAHYNITHLRRESFYSLPTGQVELLSRGPFNLIETFKNVDLAIEKNAEIAEAVLKVGLETYEIDPDSSEWKGKATPNDMDKARSTIRQLYRDWSAEGALERNACFRPMIEALDKTFPDRSEGSINVLIPGAGLGRLVLDVCAAGYNVEGNEISYHQLLMSNWILNCQTRVGEHALYPWALNFSNHLSRKNQLQSVAVPDVVAGTLMAEVHQRYEYGPSMSMSSGDFSVIYKQPEYHQSFDAILTCFFIDTAPNFIAYVDTVCACLADDGVWINMGPLLWHFEGRSTLHDSSGPDTTNKGIGDAGSFELTDDEVIALLQVRGFKVEHHDRDNHSSGYIQDPQSMLQNIYRPSFWVARKMKG